MPTTIREGWPPFNSWWTKQQTRKTIRACVKLSDAYRNLGLAAKTIDEQFLIFTELLKEQSNDGKVLRLD